jgi:hypothetical protein
MLWRFADLKAAGVVVNHDMLGQLIREEGFPPGQWLSANVHVWLRDEVMKWVAGRPRVKPPPNPIPAAERRRRRPAGTAAPPSPPAPLMVVVEE